MTLEELIAKAEIRETLTRYSTALDTPGRRWSDWDACFTPDATLSGFPGRPPVVPHMQMREIFAQSDAIAISRQHLLLNVVITLEGDRARAHSELSFSG